MSDDYSKFRGKCKEMSGQLIKENSSLTLVRGHYYCPIWDVEEQHWWCEDSDGKIFDPTKRQFPSKGMGTYTPFNGFVNCSNCGKTMLEEDAQFYSNYVFCSGECICRFVGL